MKTNPYMYDHKSTYVCLEKPNHEAFFFTSNNSFVRRIEASVSVAVDVTGVKDDADETSARRQLVRLLIHAAQPRQGLALLVGAVIHLKKYKMHVLIFCTT